MVRRLGFHGNRHGKVRLGASRCGTSWHGRLGVAWRVKIRQGGLRLGRTGTASYAKAGQAKAGMEGLARASSVGHGMAGKARLGVSMRVGARHGRETTEGVAKAALFF